MKTRNGFVSNSSSSSFVLNIELNGESKKIFLIDWLKIHRTELIEHLLEREDCFWRDNEDMSTFYNRMVDELYNHLLNERLSPYIISGSAMTVIISNGDDRFWFEIAPSEVIDIEVDDTTMTISGIMS